jgi:hypothetical protein
MIWKHRKNILPTTQDLLYVLYINTIYSVYYKLKILLQYPIVLVKYICHCGKCLLGISQISEKFMNFQGTQF